MNIFAVGLGGAGGAVIGTLLEEMKVNEGGMEHINFDYMLIDFSEGIGKLKDYGWEIDAKRCNYLDRPSINWVSTNYPEFPLESIPANPERGTGRNRSYSKVTFEWNKGKIKDGLSGVSDSFLKRIRENTVNFWVFTSFGGGSGSGMFIDVGLLLGKIKREFELEGRRVSIYGVGILPSASNRGDDAMSPPNAIQAFKELDYLISENTDEEFGIKNPFDEIFVLGLHRLMTEVEASRLKTDKIIARNILGFCYARGIDFNDILSEISGSEAGIRQKKYLSFSIGTYNFPIGKIERCKNAEDERFEHRKKESSLDDEIARLKTEIAEVQTRIDGVKSKINEIRDKIDDEKKDPTWAVSGRKIKKWEKTIKNDLEPHLKTYENERDEKEDKKQVKKKELKEVKDKIELLNTEIAEIKEDIGKDRENEIFWQECIDDTEYSEVVNRLAEMKSKSLNELVDSVKGKGRFDDILTKREKFLVDWSPLIVEVKEEKIPLLEIGYITPVGILDEGVLRTHAPGEVDRIAARGISASKYDFSFFGIIAGVRPVDINDLKIFRKDYLKFPEDYVEKNMVGFLYGKKRWSEYVPEWLEE